MESFRIPPSALRRQYVISTTILIFGGALIARLIESIVLPIDLAALLFVLFCFAVFVSYIIASRKVWVTLSPKGIIGRGMNGRETTLLWSVSVVLTPMTPPNVGTLPGITLLAIDATGSPTANGVFIPRAIFSSPQFLAAIERISPKNHPLRSALANAA